ncbi:MAG TPA: hypothetical protein VI933_04675 [archaeon]|nr:hypothetical protein [archaeon]
MVRQFEVTIQNKIGALADVSEALAKSRVNIKAISTEIKDVGLGVIKLITDDEQATRKTLSLGDFEFDEYDVVPIRLMDKPGELARLSRGLANLGVDIESVFILHKENGFTEVALKVNDLAKARKLLSLK